MNVNDEIARLRGWTSEAATILPLGPGFVWNSGDTTPAHERQWARRGREHPVLAFAPCYSSSWSLAGPLFAEMVRSGECEKWHISSPLGDGATLQVLLTFWGERAFHAPELTECIALAWLSWARAHVSECQGCERCRHLVRDASVSAQDGQLGIPDKEE